MEMLSFYYFLLFLAFFLLSRHLLFSKKKNLPPSGHLCLPIIGHLYLLKKPLHRTLARVSAQYGPILLLKFGSRRILHVSSPAAAEECFTTNDIVFANRPHFLLGKYMAFNHTTLTVAPYGQHWRNLRRLTTLEIFSTSRLEMFSTIRTNEVRSLLRRILIVAGNSSKMVEMKSLLFELTLNNMMMMIAGKRYYGDDLGDLDKARQFHELIEEFIKAAGASNVVDFLPFLRWVGFNGLEKKLVRLQGKRDQFMQKLIEEHRMARTQSKDEKVLLDVMLSLQETDPNYYTDEIIIGLIQVLITAGNDSAAGTMEWVMSLLLNHPEVLKKAQAEIDAIVGQGRLLNESDLANLPYLHCIINETLRMYPAGPLLAPHESSEECIVGGFTIPRGTMLLVNMWAIQNDPKLWEEPTKFMPERMEGIGVTSVRDGYKLMPFGSGRRSCPGEGLALRVVGLTLGSLIQCFEWERVDEELIDMTEGPGLTLSKAKPLEAKCKPRPAMLSFLSQL
ncbi:cytochrome P450 81Q32-like [Macadamia integrifolia]|uniref:cytochrome P450 81Q32-like n=1 Tax=Macadamia integrifolia TaxID=60698 RepID=UPI001C53381F|nr:cytochrome P450 81Q32-like [Macadamia integrifolia]